MALSYIRNLYVEQLKALLRYSKVLNKCFQFLKRHATPATVLKT